MENRDLIILGAGPAGLTAGIYAGRSGLSTLVIEGKMAGGEAAIAPWIENYPGFDSISGSELTKKMTNQCKKFGAQIKELERVVSLELKGEKKIVKTEKGAYSTSALIIATGTRYRLLDVPGEREFQGKGVSYCAMCDGAFFKGKNVVVVGGGNSAVTTAIYLANIAANVTLVHRRNQFRAEMAYMASLKTQPNVKFCCRFEVREIKGTNTVNSIVLADTNTGKPIQLEADGIFVQIGEVPNTQIAKEAGVAVDKEGFIIVDSRQRTNIAGVLAAGDVTNGSVKQIGVAVGQAIVATTEAFGHIKRPYYYEA